MLLHAYKHSYLMEESEACVAEAARAGTPEQMLIAGRIMEHPMAYRRWEVDHDRVIRSVSDQAKLSRQVIALRAAAFPLIHRKALFEYLRDERVIGRRRRMLFSLFHGGCDYGKSVVTEHGNFLRCSSSYLCSHSLAERLMRDAAFQGAISLYEEWYREYFRVFCDTALAETEEERCAAASLEPIKPLLKYQLAQARREIIALPTPSAERWREVEMRTPTGDTARLPSLSLPIEQVRATARRLSIGGRLSLPTSL